VTSHPSSHFWLTEIYVHNVVTVNKQVNFFSNIDFKEHANKECALSLRTYKYLQSEFSYDNSAPK